MKLPVCLFVLIVCVGSFAFAQNQSEMNRQAAAAFQKADRELNTLYQKVLTDLDAEAKAKMKVAQRAWVAFRDAEAEFQMDAEARGGSMAVMIYEGTRARLTKARIASLREFATSQESR